ncbi:MAG: NAD(P)/FAD-dependent oxidoreductase [Pseudomonadota bacterium]
MIEGQDAAFPKKMRVAIIGAGPAGLGMARVLRDLGMQDVWVLERGQIGESFLKWPTGTRLLTPSFPGNVFGVTDLNAISYDSSPGWSLKCEHPTGPAYAAYLEQAALAFGLNVQCGVEIFSVRPKGESRDAGFALTTDHGPAEAEFVIWAGGHFGDPSSGDLSGAEHGLHYSAVKRWRDVGGDEVYVIGGYESGVDAAIGLAEAGKRVVVLDRGDPWGDHDKDPSRRLSPYTLQRLDEARARLPIELTPDVDVLGLEAEEGGVRILAGDGRSWLSAGAPILATGFGPGTGPVTALFEFDDAGTPALTIDDESTVQSGVFLVGPEVSHQGQLFCFIYKFRQRFAVVAKAIAERSDVDLAPLRVYYQNGMVLDDLACCEDDKCIC